MKRRAALGLFSLIPVGMAAACQPTGPSSTTRELLIGATAEPPSLDPITADGAAIPQAVLYNVYETLIKIDDNGAFQPSLAKSWTVSDDQLSYTFTLDERATFAVGDRPVLAADVLWSLNRVREVGRAVLKTQLAPIKDMTAPDEHTVVITLSRPSNAWLFNMASTAGMVFDNKAGVDFAAVPAGSGPYTIPQWTKGSDLVFQVRATPWGTKPYYEKVTLRYFADPNAENAAMLAGQLDILSNVQAPQALGQFSDTSRYAIIEGTTQGEVVLSMNNSGVLKDLRLRQAIRHAIDHRALLDTVWAGHGTLIGSMVPPTDPWYEDLTGLYPYDPDKAKQLITAAAPSAPLRLRVPTLPYATASAQFVASQLKDVGLEVTTEELEFPARWLDLVYTKADYDLSIIAHVEPRDIVTFADPKYYWRYDNKEVQDLVAAADSGTEAEQTSKLREAATIISEDAAADFLFLLPNLVVTKPGITGIRQNATTVAFDLTAIAGKSS